MCTGEGGRCTESFVISLCLPSSMKRQIEFKDEGGETNYGSK